MNNIIEFRLWGRFALFCDPVTKIGGEKCSYHIPTYEALKGITRSIYWKPTFIWHIDKVRVIKPIRTQTKGIKPLEYGSGGNTLALYNYLSDVEYQVQAHFEWNFHTPELEGDRSEAKHYEIAQRALKRGGRQDIFLGTRECQGYVEPCAFGQGDGVYDNAGELSYGLMFHSFTYPEESGKNELHSHFWNAKMRDGIVAFPRPEQCTVNKFVRLMKPSKFVPKVNFSSLAETEALG